MAKDFRNKTFPKILRGYAPDEVDEYIARINTEYGRLEKRLAETEKKLAAAVDKLDKAGAKNIGESESVKKAVDDAKETAERIIGGAQKTADGIIKQAERRAAELEAEARKLSDSVYSFRDMLFEAYNNHIEDIERVMSEVDALTGRGEIANEAADNGTGDSYGDEGDNIPTSEHPEPKTTFIGGDLYIDPDEYGDDVAEDAASDTKEEERRRRLDRLFGIPNGDDGETGDNGDVSPRFDDSDAETDGGDDDGDTRVLDLGELLRENRKVSNVSEKVSAESAECADKDVSDEDSDFGGASSSGEFSDFSSDEIDSILGKKVRALTDEFGVVYENGVHENSVHNDGIPQEKKSKKGRR